MENLEQLSCFINRVASDVRRKPTHTSLYLALCNAWSTSQFQNVFHVSRRQLMCAAHIRSIATYHKVIGDLQAFGYLDYGPSYHPVKGSRVSLKVSGRSLNTSTPPFFDGGLTLDSGCRHLFTTSADLTLTSGCGSATWADLSITFGR